ncbi:MAG: nitrate/nitrite transporter NrtS [Cyanobacteria bacterium P01_G01_bin.67]
MNQLLQIFLDRKLAPTALRVSLIVGSILFTINHGAALAKGEMTRTRWLSGIITYLVPYSVSIHGQHTSRSRSSVKN